MLLRFTNTLSFARYPCALCGCSSHFVLLMRSVSFDRFPSVLCFSYDSPFLCPPTRFLFYCSFTNSVSSVRTRYRHFHILSDKCTKFLFNNLSHLNVVERVVSDWILTFKRRNLSVLYKDCVRTAQ